MSNSPGQNRNHSERLLPVFFSTPVRLIRHTLISLLVSAFLKFLLTANLSQRSVRLSVKKCLVFRGMQSIIVIFRQLFTI